MNQNILRSSSLHVVWLPTLYGVCKALVLEVWTRACTHKLGNYTIRDCVYYGECGRMRILTPQTYFMGAKNPLDGAWTFKSYLLICKIAFKYLMCIILVVLKR